VDRVAFGTIGDLFGGDQDKVTVLFEQIAILIEGFDSYLVLVRAGFTSGFDLGLSKAPEVSIHALAMAAFLYVLDVHPFDALLQNVVIGDRQKVVTILHVPIGYHFGEIVSIAPERVGMEVSFPPAGLRIGICLLSLRGKSAGHRKDLN